MPSAATTTRHAVCVHACAYARARTYALTYSTHATGKFIDNVTLPGGREASHYRYSDPLGPISMADHDLYLDRATGTPVRVSASFHPFGVFVVRGRRRSNVAQTRGRPPSRTLSSPLNLRASLIVFLIRHCPIFTYTCHRPTSPPTTPSF